METMALQNLRNFRRSMPRSASEEAKVVLLGTIPRSNFERLEKYKQFHTHCIFLNWPTVGALRKVLLTQANADTLRDITHRVRFACQ